MDAGLITAIVVVVLVVLGVIAVWAIMRRRDHPEDTASHDTRATAERRQDERMAPYPGTDRPAGPGAEGMAAPEPGAVAPGPEPPNDNSGQAPDPNLSHRHR